MTNVRPAVAGDVVQILAFIRELAAYEREPDAVLATEVDLLRGHGIGKALLAQVAAVAVVEGCPRLEWDVLAWNEPAIGFYERLGATIQTEWRIVRIADEGLARLADRGRA